MRRTLTPNRNYRLLEIAAMNRDYLRGSWRERDNFVTAIKPFTEWSTGSKLQTDNRPAPANQQ